MVGAVPRQSAEFNKLNPGTSSNGTREHTCYCTPHRDELGKKCILQGAAACLSILSNLLGSPNRMISDRDSRECSLVNPEEKYTVSPWIPPCTSMSTANRWSECFKPVRSEQDANRGNNLEELSG